MEFPDELFINILVRLPIKDIFRFKGVCKSWFRLISDPYFTNFYARNSPFSILFRMHENFFGKKYFSLLQITEKGEFTQMPISHAGPDFCTSVIGLLDSSVFLLHRRLCDGHEIDRVDLFNPVLGSCFKVTEDYRVDITRFVMGYKVGYIPSNSTYKLFRYISHVAPNVDDWYKNDAVKVLTIGLDKNWRNMDESLCLTLRRQVLCLNGAYHWVSEEDNMICTFDILEEKNGTGIPIPHGVMSRRISLTILNRLCLSVIDQPDDDTMVLWSMKEYGVMESWSKVTVLTFRNPYPKFRSVFRSVLPVAVFPNGNILLTVSNDIFIFSQEEKRLTQIECPYPDRGQPSYTWCVNMLAPRFCTLEVMGAEIGG